MNTHASLASRLPTEVLCIIFFLSLPHTGHLLPISQSSPMLLTRICRRWREVSEVIPLLWCKLSITVDETNIQQSVFCYDSWLKRTRGHPLSLQITCTRYSCSFLRPLLQPYSNQISSLEIRFDNSMEKQTVLNNLPGLQEPRVNMTSNLSILRCTLPIPQLSSLRTLEFKGISNSNFDSLPDLDPIWARLSNLTLDSYEHDAVIRLLRLAPDLSSLTICLLLGYALRLEPLTHTNIQSLSIKASRGYYHTCSRHHLRMPVVTNFLNALTLPNLRVLDVHSRSWTGEELKGAGRGTVGMAWLKMNDLHGDIDS